MFIGGMLLNTGRVAEGLKRVHSAVKHLPDEALAKALLAEAYSVAGDWEGALRHALPAVAGRPANPRLHWLVAWAYHKTGKTRKAAEHALKAASLGYTPTHFGDHLLLASAYETSGDLVNALGSLLDAKEAGADVPSSVAFRLAVRATKDVVVDDASPRVGEMMLVISD